MHATCEQHTQTSISASKSQYSFSCQLLPILLLYRAQRLLAARLIPPGASRQTPHAAVLLFLQSKSQPSGLQQPHFRQPLSTFIHSVLQPSNIPHPLSPLTFHQKKLSRRLSFPVVYKFYLSRIVQSAIFLLQYKTKVFKDARKVWFLALVNLT